MAKATRILVPTDFSSGAKAALNYAIFLAGKLEAAIDVVHVLWNPPPLVGIEGLMVQSAQVQSTLGDVVRRQAQEQMEHFLKDLPAPWRERSHARFITGEAAQAIVEEAQQLGVDLIVMGTRGRSGLAHLFVGSVAERVVRHAGCPVVTVHDTKTK